MLDQVRRQGVGNVWA